MFLVIAAVLIYVAAMGQERKTVEKAWNIELGPAVSHPIRYLNMFSTLGLGLDGAIIHPFNNGFAAGVRVNYLYFLGRAGDPAFTGGGSHYKHSNLYNALAEVSYCYNHTFIVGLNPGLSVVTFNGHSDPSFAKKLYVGYKWDHEAHPIVFAVFYEQTDYHKNAGLRATIRF